MIALDGHVVNKVEKRVPRKSRRRVECAIERGVSQSISTAHRENASCAARSLRLHAAGRTNHPISHGVCIGLAAKGAMMSQYLCHRQQQRLGARPAGDTTKCKEIDAQVGCDHGDGEALISHLGRNPWLAPSTKPPFYRCGGGLWLHPIIPKAR